jgi:extracellular factor (EF) 3-hydroxypalmitic acid methyl ester biosynthesis protein
MTQNTMAPPDGSPAPETVALDAALVEIDRGDGGAALEKLRSALATLRSRATPERWSEVVLAARRHPLCKVLHEDPFTLRCYAKPRGYPGDAVALDYVLNARPGGTPEARVAQVHQYMTQGAFARALRFRRDYFARMIDEAASSHREPIRVFAAGAGHLRELGAARAGREGRIGRFVAFDNDPQNLDVVRRDHGALVEPRQGSLRQLVEGRHDFAGAMDLVYCSGVMETLPQVSAQGLVKTLFSMLSPGGRLVLSNFLPGLPDAALLEIYFDWRMTLRNQGEIFALAAPMPKEAIGSWLYSENADATIGFLTVDRRGGEAGP